MIEQQQWDWFSGQLAEFDDRLEGLRLAAVDSSDLRESIGLAELETCREELRVAEEELRTQHDELLSVAGNQPVPTMNERLLDDLPVATLASDRLGLLTGVSRPAAQLLGEATYQIVGKPLAAYITGDRKPFRQLLGRLAGGEHLDRVHVDLRGVSAGQSVQNTVPAVLIARRDADRVRWVVVPDDAFTPTGWRDHPGAIARENAHVSIASLSRLPVTTATMSELLADIEQLALAALPNARQITFVLDDASADDIARPPEFSADHQSYPLLAHGSRLGGMYVSESCGPPEPGEQSTAKLFADAAAAVVSNARALHESRELVDHLSHALEHRSIIEQAKGILMAVRNCGEDAAFDYLRVVSQRSNTKLHEVARGLVTTMSTTDPRAR